jgi:hypothetical protein
VPIDGKLLEVVSDYLSEALDSQDPVQQRQALTLSERMGWQSKSLKEHRDFLIDCGGALVNSDLALHSLLTLTWKIRFWQSLDEPIRSLLGSCHFEICDRDRQKSLVIHCASISDLDCLYKSLNLISQNIYSFTGYVHQVDLTLSK